MKLLLQMAACIAIGLTTGAFLGHCLDGDLKYNEARNKAEREREPLP